MNAPLDSGNVQWVKGSNRVRTERYHLLNAFLGKHNSGHILREC